MSFLGKGSKAYSIFALKCPKCHEEDLFETGSLSFKNSFEMRQECPNCKQNFFPEPGFYYGAMFISYIFMGWFCIGFVLFFHWVLDWSTAASFGLLILFCAVFFVYIFRLARSIWLNINYRYDPAKAKKA
ncbi:MAG TPA: DUF983 domain-containing protein [Saprospiraceae bacterium]|nr:DUF983 domain-containing protein [Saprospiraceae bacterium]HMQ85293.1 DUF983 domain-containing protein [Saprospiraceae bacterium]